MLLYQEKAKHVAVVILPTLPANQTILDTATRIYGDLHLEPGVLILIGRDPVRIGILPGTNEEAFLTNGRAMAIRDAVASHVDVGDYDGAASAGVAMVLSTYGVIPRSEQGKSQAAAPSIAPSVLASPSPTFPSTATPFRTQSQLPTRSVLPTMAPYPNRGNLAPPSLGLLWSQGNAFLAWPLLMIWRINEALAVVFFIAAVITQVRAHTSG